ncbi:MAG: vWA domain-containing protein [Myxococcota bacterium]
MSAPGTCAVPPFHRVQAWSRLFASTCLLGLWSCQCSDASITRLPVTVKGTLCHPVTGAPAAGQTLVAENGAQQWSQDTGDDGNAQLLRVEGGEITVRILHRARVGGDPVHDSIFRYATRDGQTVDVVDPACLVFPLAEGTGGIQGTFCRGSTPRYATLALSDGTQRITDTDTSGHFLFADVPPGDHLLHLRSSDFSRTYPIYVQSGQISHLQVGSCTPPDENTGVIAGQLCATNGAGPWALATVSVELPNGDVRSDLTDIDGQFLLDGITPGTHDVMVRGGGESMDLTATVASGETSWVQPQATCEAPDPTETGQIRGQLCDPVTRGWLAGAVVHTTQGAVTFLDHTDELGMFHLAGLSPGEVEVQVDRAAYHHSFTVPVTAGETVLVADGECVPPTGQCLTEELPVERAIPLQVMLVVDKSGSMAEDGLDGNKWDSAVRGVVAVTRDLQNEAAFGLTLFPGGDSAQGQCDTGRVAVPMSLANARAIEEALVSSVPGGGTPTASTVHAVHQHFADTGLTTTTVVILATDGVPNCNHGLDPYSCHCPAEGCGGDGRLCMDDDGTLASIATLAEYGVRTFVIGLPGSEDPSDVLGRMAQAGGTSASADDGYYRPQSTEELVEDMASIVRRNHACRFELSSTPNDPGRVQVRLDGVVVQRDPARRSGWDLLGERGLEVYGPPCQELRAGTGHTLAVEYCVD